LHWLVEGLGLKLGPVGMLKLAVFLAFFAVVHSKLNYAPSPNAIALQEEIDKSIALQGASSVSVSAGDYYFGNASLVIHRASNFTLRAQAGPGTVQLWFTIGTGVLVNQSSDVVLDGMSVDYDPPAHYQGTIVQVIDDNSSSMLQALVKTDVGFLGPAVFDAEYHMGMPGVQDGPKALVWNSSDPGFGAFAGASWPPTAAADGNYMFNLSRATFCKDISNTLSDGSSCLNGSTSKLQPLDKITAHIRKGFTLHLLNSTRIHTQHTAIHGAPGFGITEYDGYGKHSYLNVSLGYVLVQRTAPLTAPLTALLTAPLTAPLAVATSPTALQMDRTMVGRTQCVASQTPPVVGCAWG
jgi:hypothetical protein